MSRGDERLIAAAVAAQKNAYCPYSRFPVGAAVMTDAGRIFAGCNVENASYGLSLCAERSAVINAVARGQTAIKSIAVVASQARPCGACRQFVKEFSTKGTVFLLVDLNPRTGRRSVTRTTVDRLLPDAFDPLSAGLIPAHLQNILRSGGKRKGAKKKR